MVKSIYEQSRLVRFCSTEHFSLILTKSKFDFHVVAVVRWSTNDCDALQKYD